MAAKKQPALSTQLKAAQARIEELEKKVKTETESKDRFYRDREAVSAELEQVHAILDAIPNAPARHFKPEEAYGTLERKTPARLAAFFAIR
jgi:chromosome segregation ATPase